MQGFRIIDDSSPGQVVLGRLSLASLYPVAWTSGPGRHGVSPAVAGGKCTVPASQTIL